MAEITANVNWVAVIAGAVLAYLLGWLWYSPKLFGAKWAEGVRIKFDGSGLPAAAMITQAIATFLLSWVVGVTAANNALMTAVLIVATIVAVLAAGGLFIQKSTYANLTDTGYIVAMAIIMIACQAIL